MALLQSLPDISPVDGQSFRVPMPRTTTKPDPAETAETPNRNQRRRQRTRETILVAAEKIFRLKGIDHATVNIVTEEADVAYGSFYNHFKCMEEVVKALAEQSLQRVADRTGAIVMSAERVELLPCVGARVVMRTLWHDPAIRWMLKRPNIFVEAFHKVATPFMVAAEKDAVASGQLKPVGGHEAWLRTFPWILIGELTELVESGRIIEHEERFAAISLRLLGVDDALAPGLISRSRELVDASGLRETKPRGPKRL
jgi:AcrR family transcriptional regulator